MQAAVATSLPAVDAPAGQAPFRGESRSVEQLEEYARTLAAQHQLSPHPPYDRTLMRRFEDNCRTLSEAYEQIAAAAATNEPITPDAEWLLDNFYVVEEQLREIREDLPRGYLVELPALADGDDRGLPRVYAITRELVVHTDSGVDEESLSRTIRAYQEQVPLTMGEVWAVPIMLRLVLVENLRRLAGDVTQARHWRLHADAILERARETGEGVLRLCGGARASALLMRLAERLSSAGAEGIASLHELERGLAGEGLPLDEVSRNDCQRQASNQVSIGNCITSMRLIGVLDWTAFFEAVSLVEAVLRRDPAGVYPRMDFGTRDRYRHVIEKLARRARASELELAERVVGLAVAAQELPEGPPVQHIGYYLLGDGRVELERALTSGRTSLRPLRERAGAWSTQLYLAAVAAITLAIVGGLVAYAISAHLSGFACLAVAVLALLPASEVAVTLVNVVVTLLWPPRVLPKLDFRQGVPQDARTLVVVPAMLVDAESVATLIERLEMHYLANPEQGLSFALLTDFPDADRAELPGDAALVEQARERIDRLNARYPDEEGPRFHFLHRQRRWNAVERCWMGWERKRGKLIELNRLLLGTAQTTYTVCWPSAPPVGVFRYVISLDADTQLPHGTARRLVGTLAHPLNRARLSDDGSRVESGVAILQPRVGVTLTSAARSVYARVFAAGPGLDPYTAAASDVYQDLFGEGSFIGKGIYDIRAFTATADRAFPENRILSHDLIEGCHARAALASDIEVIDDQPARYDVDARRLHRWARGDWQLLPWLGREAPSADGPRPNCLSPLSRFKVFDNLRRSLVAPASVAMAVLGGCVWGGSAWVWIVAALLPLLAPALVQCVLAVQRVVKAGMSKASWRRMFREWGRAAAQLALQITFFADRAYLMLDAAIRSLFRMFVSGRHLLEWETAAATERRLRTKRYNWLRAMWFPTTLALGLAAAAAFGGMRIAPPLVALLIVWGVSPAVAGIVSRPGRPVARSLSESQRRELRWIAREFWSFFEVFVGPAGHWLPPDNMQEVPRQQVAQRLSPTNEGLFVLSAAVAREFGFTGLHDVVNLLERNFEHLGRLDRHRGHLFNWYAIDTLTALHPRYVSTVDSGNLVGCLLAAQTALATHVRAPILDSRHIEGLRESLGMVERARGRAGAEHIIPTQATIREIEGVCRQLRGQLRTAPRDVWTWQARLAALAEPMQQLVQLTAHYSGRDAATDELHLKAQLLEKHRAGLQRDLEALFPWHSLVAAEPPSYAAGRGAEAWTRLRRALGELRAPASLSAAQKQSQAALAQLRELLTDEHRAAAEAELSAIERAVEAGVQAAGKLVERSHRLGTQYERWAHETDFRLVYDTRRKLFTIGFNFEDAQPDRSHYDLLASEARLASLLAIAKGDVDYRHWFQLGRQLTRAAGSAALVSWGGTMFEYLMPILLTRSIRGSLLDASCQAAIKRQIEYGAQRCVPWGISESAFGEMAANSDYHYKSFGTPGLGLKRGLAKDLVIAPYATALASMLAPAAAAVNLARLASQGALGHWGFYDALDYTPRRRPVGRQNIVVRCYMAHHQGMSLVALANCLMDNRAQRWFHAHPLPRSVELLLQERVPDFAPTAHAPADDVQSAPLVHEAAESFSRHVLTADTPAPKAHFLTNGRYTVMMTNAGGGYSRYQGQALTRWRPDATLDNWGQFIYLRDAQGRAWSAGFQPTRAVPDNYEAIFSLDKVEIRRLDGLWETLLEATVSPEDAVEVRRLAVHNHAEAAAEIEITSYLEPVLAAPRADLAHPAFSKLFLSTEFLADRGALVVGRRPRVMGQETLWLAHILTTAEGTPASLDFESDRARFLGRGRDLRSPAAMIGRGPLSRTTGPVLDPALVLRHRLRVGPNETRSIALTTAVASSRDEVLALVDKYRDMRVVQRSFELAWAHSQVERRHRHLPEGTLHLFQRLASMLVYPDADRRTAAPRRADRAQSLNSLWSFGISGDLPMVVARVTQAEQESLIRELLRAQEYWRTLGVAADLVIVDDRAASYNDTSYEDLRGLIQESRMQATPQGGGIHLLRGSQTPDLVKATLAGAAAILLDGDRGPLVRQVEEQPRPRNLPPALEIVRHARPHANAPRASLPQPALAVPHARGGFAAGGECHIRVKATEATPMPWSNVIAGPRIGCVVSESGLGCTWVDNSHENRITPWANDPVADPPAEAVYVRDEETGEVWSPTPLPAGAADEFLVTHGFGATRFEHVSHGLAHEFTVSVAHDAPVKFLHVSLTNRGSQARRLSLTYYADLVLGAMRDHTQWNVVTAIDPASGALLASNPLHPDTPGAIAFFCAVGRAFTVTGDRREFLGRNGSWRTPLGLTRRELSGFAGAGVDPGAAVKTTLELAAGATSDVVFVLGQAASRDELTALLDRYSDTSAVRATMDEVATTWRTHLDTIQVKTPEPELDVLLNGWLLYQTLSCRYWGRTATYQSGGAFGFRDQLQDVMALVYGWPALAREHILRAAGRQFDQGDVQHWWHEPSGRGIRSRCSDDLLWLPWVVSQYVEVTGDTGILDERVGYLQSPELQPQEEERYEQPGASSLTEELYRHCLRAIERGSRFGAHGLPLIGTCDWNDGMNRVGVEGRGESVWLGWFLTSVLERFAGVAENRGEAELADKQREAARTLRAAVEEHGWDGGWYRRAYFDDGAPLGSASNDECRIDSLSQSWSVLAGGDPRRSGQALDALEEHLIKPDDKMIVLLAPPFGAGSTDPGYIKGYLPGIRENGGQYTHAATWVVQAFARAGRGTKAVELLGMINPLRHTANERDLQVYKVEPYVAAADVYYGEPHTGRGGWTWYTGSASWMYRVAIEDILGLRRRGARLRIDPCIAAHWPGFELTYRAGRSAYRISVENPERVERGVKQVLLDGHAVSGVEFDLADDGRAHEVRVILGRVT